MYILFIFGKKHLYLFKTIFSKILFIFRQNGRKGEGKRERTSMCGCISHALRSTQACALTGNRTGDPLVFRPVLSPLSHTSQGYSLFFDISSHTLSWVNFEKFKNNSVCFKCHTRENQVPVWLLCADGGLPKPELISRIEQGAELFRKLGEPQKSGNIICNPADLHFGPVVEGQQFWSKYEEISPVLTMSHSGSQFQFSELVSFFGWAEACSLLCSRGGTWA